MKLKILLSLSFFLSLHPVFSQCGINITETHTPETAAGPNNGTITVTITGGSPQFYFILDENGSTISDIYSSDSVHTFSSLAPGTYDVWGIDTTTGAPCSDGITGVVIDDYIPSGILDCAGAVPVTCGTPYNGNTTNGVNNVESYSCTTWTETGREIVHTYTPTTSEPFSVKLTNYNGDKDVYILESCDAASCAGQVFSDSAYYANGVAGTTYYIVVDDDLGVNGPYTLNVSCGIPTDPCDSIDLTLTPTADVDSAGTGTATAGVETLPSGVSISGYLWSNNDTLATTDSLDAGDYYVTVSFSNGCSIVDTVTVPSEQTTPCTGITHSLNASNETAAGNDGSASMVVAGVPINDTIEYTWSSGDTLSIADSLSAGTYSVTVDISNGCTFIDSITIVNDTADPCNGLSLVPSSTPESGSGNMDGSAGITVSGLTLPDTAVYSWDDPQNGTTPTITGLSAGNYAVTVTVSTGCVLIDTIAVDVNSSCNLDINFIRTHQTDTNVNDGSAIVTVAGGSGDYEYFWSNGAGDTNAIYNLAPGMYTVTVTDLSNNCLSIDSVRIFSIEDPCLLVIQINSLGSTGSGQTDGAASVLVSGGEPPYTYTWNTGSIESQIFNLSAGIYVVTVEDSEGCQDVQVASLNVISVLELEEQNIVMNLYPNPTSEFLTISFELEKQLKASIAILDVQGRRVENVSNNTLNSGTNTQSIDVSNLAKGLYFIELKTNKESIQKAFIIK